jgi:hypothetical protein
MTSSAPSVLKPCREFSSCASDALMLRRFEEQLALRLGGRDLDQTPVLEDVFVDLRLDPVHGEGNQPHAAVRIEALDRLHQADVAFLNQVGMGQSITQIAAGDGDHQAQVRSHQLPCSVEVLPVAEAAGESLLLGFAEHRYTIRGRNEGLDAAAGGQHRVVINRQRLRHGATSLNTILALLN